MSYEEPVVSLPIHARRLASFSHFTDPVSCRNKLCSSVKIGSRVKSKHGCRHLSIRDQSSHIHSLAFIVILVNNSYTRTQIESSIAFTHAQLWCETPRHHHFCAVEKKIEIYHVKSTFRQQHWDFYCNVWVVYGQNIKFPLEISPIRKWPNRMMRWMDAYRTGLNVKDPQLRVQAFWPCDSRPLISDNCDYIILLLYLGYMTSSGQMEYSNLGQFGPNKNRFGRV